MNTHHTDVQGSSPARTFAKIFGPVLLVVGILGLLLGNDPLVGALNIDILEDVIHVASGLLLIFLGFKARSAAVRTGVLVLGIVYLVVTVLGFAAPDVIESLMPHGYTLLDNIIHLATGVLAVVAALMSKDRADNRV